MIITCEQAHLGAQARGALPRARNRGAKLWSLQIFHFHPGNRGKNKPKKNIHFTNSQRDQPPVGFIAQLIAHRYRRGHGFESRLSLIFFGFTFDTAFLSYIHNFDNLQCLKYILPSQFKYVFIYVSNYYLPLLAQKSLFVSFSLHKEAKRTISGRASTNRPREQSSVWKRTTHSLLSGRTIHGKHR